MRSLKIVDSICLAQFAALLLIVVAHGLLSDGLLFFSDPLSLWIYLSAASLALSLPLVLLAVFAGAISSL